MTEAVKALYEQLETCADNDERLKILFNICTSLLDFDEKRVLQTAEELKQLAESIDSNVGRSYYHSTLGRVYIKKTMFAESEAEFTKALEMTLLTPELILQGMAYDSLGILYGYQHNYQAGLEACYKALAIYQQLPGSASHRFQLVCYNNIGLAYKIMRNLEKAEESFQKGLELANVETVGSIKFSLLNNIGNVKSLQGKYDEALPYVQAALAGYKEQNNKHGAAHAMVVIARCHLGKGEFAVAMSHFLATLKLLKGFENKMVEVKAVWGLGEVYMKMEAFEEAIKHYQKALEVAAAMGDEHTACDIYLDLGEAYQALGQLELAKNAFETGMALTKKVGLHQEHDILRKKSEMVLN